MNDSAWLVAERAGDRVMDLVGYRVWRHARVHVMGRVWIRVTFRVGELVGEGFDD